jgi:hypothetical protein
MKTAYCPKCGVDPGHFHKPDCCAEQCPYCGWLREGGICECNPPPLDDRIRWSGEWQGIEECREYGFYTKWVRGQAAIPCDKDEPGAIPCLITLQVMTRWDRERKRFVLK